MSYLKTFDISLSLDKHETVKYLCIDQLKIL